MRSAVMSLGFMLLLLCLFAWMGRITAGVKAREAWERLPGATTKGERAPRRLDPLAPARFALRHQAALLSLAATLAALAVTRMMPVAICTGLLVLAFWRFKTRRAARKHGLLLREQVPELLEALVQPLKAGLSLPSALEDAEDEVPEPLASEVRKAVSDLRMGMPLDAALEGMSERCGGREVRLASSALLQQRAAGGNLPHLLETLRSVMRDRAMLAREMKVLTAQGKLSGYLVASLPAAFLAIECLFSRSAVQALFTRPAGWAILGLGLGLEVLGLLVIRRICNSGEEV